MQSGIAQVVSVLKVFAAANEKREREKFIDLMQIHETYFKTTFQ